MLFSRSAGIGLLVLAFVFGLVGGQGAQDKEAPGNPFAGVGELQLIKDGYKKMDTPCWLPQEGYLVVTDVEQGKLFQLTTDKQLKVLHEKATRGVTAPDGRWIGMMDGKLVAWRPGGKEQVLAEKAAHDRPLDLVISSKGFVYFSTLKDPEKGRLSILNTKTGAVAVAWEGEKEPTLWNPNGVALSPDEKYLYVGISSYVDQAKSAMYRFPINDDGSLAVEEGKKAKWAAVRRPDGIAVDQKGNVYATALSVVVVLSPEGKQLGNVKIPKGSGSNLAFGGPDLKTLYVTTHNALYQLAVPIPGTLP
jgi:gluconolactonase